MSFNLEKDAKSTQVERDNHLNAGETAQVHAEDWTDALYQSIFPH